MTVLESLPGIGPKLAADLQAVGIRDAESLHRLGAGEAADRLEAAGLRDCTHARRALEGALVGTHWTAAGPRE